MRIFIDIGHPAHVHYFKNFIAAMEKDGHRFRVSARDKEVIHFLLKKYNIAYFNRGKGANSIVGKFAYLFYANVKLLRHSTK